MDEHFHKKFMKIPLDNNDSINKMLIIKSVNTALLQATMELEKLSYVTSQMLENKLVWSTTE